MATKEEIRQAVITAVAKRIVDEQERRRKAAAAAVPEPESPPVSPPATPSEIHSGDGYVRLNVAATQTFGAQNEELAFRVDSPQSFKRLVVGPTKDGTLEWKIQVKWKYPDVKEKDGGVTKGVEGSGFARVRVPFTITPERDLPLKWHVPDEFHADGLGGAVELMVPNPPVTTEELPDGGTISITPTIKFQEHVSVEDVQEGDAWVDEGKWYVRILKGAATAVGQGGAADKVLGGGVTKHGPGHREQTSFTTTNSYTLSFVAHVQAPAKPEPAKEPDLLVVTFEVASDVVSRDQRDKIHEWYKGLEKNVLLLDSIQEGKSRVHLLGRASTTGTHEFNDNLAGKRAQAVEVILKKFLGDGADIKKRSSGKADAIGRGEDQEDRVVEVTVTVHQ